MKTSDESLRYPIGREEEGQFYNSLYGDTLKFELLNDIKMLPSMLEFSVQDLDEDQLDTPYRPGGWTVKQLVHHIADSHMNAYIRFKLALTEDNPVIKPYDEAKWAELPDTKVVPINVSLTLLHALHTRWVALMNEMSLEQWSETVYHPELKRTVSLWQFLKSYAWHSLHHTAQISRLRERMKWN
jgi:uncharacterized damage-inducible protein DinB